MKLKLLLAAAVIIMTASVIAAANLTSAERNTTEKEYLSSGDNSAKSMDNGVEVCLPGPFSIIIY